MRPIRALLIYLATVFIGGAVLAPWLYWSVQWLAEQSPVFQTLFQKLAGNPFHRFVNRSLLALAVIGLWPLVRGLGMNSWTDLGLVRPWEHRRWLAAGLVVGFASLACVGLITLALGARDPGTEIPVERLSKKLFIAAVSAGVVAVMEEVLFRGAVFGGLRKTCRRPTAVVISSAIYAIVHFFHRPASPDPIQWTTGFLVLGQMLSGFVDLTQVIPGLLNLTLAGALLALAYQRTGNLYFSIGLHSGWIFWLKSYGLLTRTVPGGSDWMWGSGKLTDGWLALMALACCWPAVKRFTAVKEGTSGE